MSYLILPSSRVISLSNIIHKITILPFKSQQIHIVKHQNHSFLASSYQKTLSIYDINLLNKEEIKPIATASFAKKIQGITSNNIDLFYVTDKFGDIYSVDFKGQAKYLNSNLGIPTFLQYIKSSKGCFIAVGDQDTRVKIYNNARMHEIKAFWFFASRLPLQIIQIKNQSLVLCLKKQNSNNIQQQDSKSYLQLYNFTTQQIRQSQFSGNLFYVSQDKEQEKQCKYQSISEVGDHLVVSKLFNKILSLIVFKLNQKIEYSKTIQIQIEQNNWDYLESKQVQNNQLGIVLGKIYEFDTAQNNQNLQMIPQGNYLKCQINKNQLVLIVNIE